ncbi:MAG: alpha/beta hydrolase [Nodularia sp. (in: Bacteria)]|nr:MAG: alpha/beta hydrolase [Nodularia sp. (in: cyanobacteria)]
MGRNWKNLKIVASFWGAIALTQLCGPNTSVRAAETVVVRFGPFAESISLSELQNMADTGEFPRGLELYTGRISEEQRNFLSGALRARVPIDVVTLSRLLNTQIGTTILSNLSEALVRRDQAGVQALRAAFVLGATEPKGLSILDFIAAYPSQRLEINLLKAFQVAARLNTSFWRTQQFMLDIAPELDSRTPQISLPFDPSQTGTAQVQVLNLNWNDQNRSRDIPVDIYSSNATTSEKPVIIFTHGLGSVRHELRYLANHLASHGYVVAALEHPGSNETNTNLAAQGKSRLLQPQEFLERPRDITFVLDELEKLNQTANHPLQGKLATNNAMVVGYSFGGGTALAIAGGELQLEGLKQRCQGNLAILSLGETIQCVAQELPENSYTLRDDRIKQAIALSPTSSLMFGETGLNQVQVPTLVLASSADKSTPALSEQIIGFHQIPAPKWLVGIIGGTHLSVKDPSTTLDQVGKLDTPFGGGEIVGEQAVDVRQFVKSITLAMAAQLTPEADQYAVFLTSDYAQLVSTAAFPFRLVREIPPSAMSRVKKFESN